MSIQPRESWPNRTSWSRRSRPLHLVVVHAELGQLDVGAEVGDTSKLRKQKKTMHARTKEARDKNAELECRSKTSVRLRVMIPSIEGCLRRRRGDSLTDLLAVETWLAKKHQLGLCVGVGVGVCVCV